MRDPNRARAIVKKAATLIRKGNHEARSWLEMDEQGSHEKTAAAFLDRLEGVEHKYTDEEIDAGIAHELAYAVLTAQLKSVQRRLDAKANEPEGVRSVRGGGTKRL